MALPGMAKGRVLKSHGRNGTFTSVIMGKLSLQSPALSKQALNFMLNKKALSADRKSILYLVKCNNNNKYIIFVFSCTGTSKKVSSNEIKSPNSL